MRSRKNSGDAAGMSIEFDWNLIRSFLAVIESGSLTGAARTLSSTQPTIGRHIELLETQLGKVLFERTGRGLEPTHSALMIADHARRMQNEADRLARVVVSSEHAARALVSIAASRQVARQILPGMVVRIQESAPGIDIGIVASDEVSNLLRRDADIAIRNVRPQQSSLVIKKVGEMRVQAYASRGYVRRHGMPETMQDLLRHPLVGADRDPEFARAIEHSANTSGVDTAAVRVAVRSDDYSTQFAAVRAGLGIGFSLSGLINRHDDLQVVEIGTSLPHVPFWLAVHREIRTAPAIRTVFDMLSELLKAELR